MQTFKRNEIVILLGAGASHDANIPHSGEMIRKLEKLIRHDPNWAKYKHLYDYIRSSIYHYYGIQGKFGDDVPYNIEALVNTLDEIRKKKEHTLYPFVGAWNPTLVELAGPDFELITQLRDEIIKVLRKDWVVLRENNHASYYEKLVHFRRQYEHPLRVFSLNYDLCLEKACHQAEIERGFNDKRKWDWHKFDDKEEATTDIYLYKLHGSTDWMYEGDDLIFFDDPSPISDAAIIFGTSYKLQYRDPFLFLAYEFRKWTLESKIIISIGYGFGDEHINKILEQALKADESRKLLSIAPLNLKPYENDIGYEQKQQAQKIAFTLGAENRNQIEARSMTAKDFFLNHLNLENLASLFPQEEDLFPIIN